MWTYQVPPTCAKLLKYVDIEVQVNDAMRCAHSETAQCERYQCFLIPCTKIRSKREEMEMMGKKNLDLYSEL